VPPKDVVLVAPGTLPKTSSGKLQRSLCRQRYLGTELQRV
jgi:fatty-acyl-CoA synthase